MSLLSRCNRSSIFSNLTRRNGKATSFLSSQPDPTTKHPSSVNPAPTFHPHRQYSSTRYSPSDLRARILSRYPELSKRDIPSVTLSFLVLHELTAIVPLIVIFLILNSTGTGKTLYDYIQSTLLSIPAEEGLNNDQDGDKQSQSRDGDLLSVLRSKLTGVFEEGSRKIERLSQKYGQRGSKEVRSDGSNGVEHFKASEVVNGGMVASGLVAYLFVKALLPVRIGLSLYLAPACASAIRRILNSSRKSQFFL
ncbi:hypothetical protein BY996DRAFT_7121520, partial [Phakopsora pachyrhizi]